VADFQRVPGDVAQYPMYWHMCGIGFVIMLISKEQYFLLTDGL